MCHRGPCEIKKILSEWIAQNHLSNVRWEGCVTSLIQNPPPPQACETILGFEIYKLFFCEHHFEWMIDFLKLGQGRRAALSKG